MTIRLCACFVLLRQSVLFSVFSHVFSHVLPVALPVLLPIQLEIFLMFLAPVQRPLTAGLFPGRVLRLFVLKVVRVPVAPFFHIFELALILALERRAYRLVGAVFIRKERFTADPAGSFFCHKYTSLL